MQPDPKQCVTCGAALPDKKNPGRPRKFCSEKCRRADGYYEWTCCDCGHVGKTNKTPSPKRCRPCNVEYRRDITRFRVEIPGLIPIYDKDGACDFARVDIEDWERFKDVRFSFTAKRYPARNAAEFGGRTQYLHRMILGLEAGVRRKHEQTDHINRDPTDNRKSNLRVVTAKENCANRGGVFERAA